MQLAFQGCRHLDPVATHYDASAHFFERLRKAHVALDRIPADTFDAHRATADGAERQEVGGRRRITLDMNHSGRAIPRTGRYDKALPSLARDVYAEARHDRQRDIDIRPGNQFPDHFDRRFDTGQRQRHQQSGQELARYVAAHTHEAARPDRRRTQFKRWKTFATAIGDVGTQFAQRIDEVTDRPLMHTWHTSQRVTPTRQRQ